ncbi:hypothetical protein CK203_056779 [Vitis vinifera]|uniref:Retrotransposon gag domain-containing protein n=1 Tax=Vitis vinifera TaxID=29760 RepID=A0A438FVJ1_VITVI|nr:hypothetical protein CK203_056779 [Vitis vinifera]
MDQQVVTVDQFTTAMASIQEALASLRQEICGQQSRPPVVQDETPHDSLPPSPPPPVPSVPRLHPMCYMVILRGYARASLPAKFRMPDIERYTGIGCPCIHIRLYSTVMRAHGLDEPQMITLFPLSLSGVAQRWFASLESSRRRTWDDLAQEKIAEIVDKPSERDQIQMVLRSLQPRISKHVVGVPFTDFGSLVLALYDVEDDISRGLWADSSPSDVKGKKPFKGQRSIDVSALSFLRPQAPHPTYDQTYQPQTLALPYYATQGIERPPVSYTATGQPCYAAQFTPRPAPSYPRPRAQQTSTPFALRTQRQFS